MGVVLKIIIIAEPNEIKLIPKDMQEYPIIITGIGASNVEKTLPHIKAYTDLHPDGIEVFNYGYCGSNLPIGTTVRIGKKHKCITVDEFAENIPDGVGEKDVVDMELEYVKLYFPNVISYKTVSDHFDLDEHRRNI